MKGLPFLVWSEVDDIAEAAVGGKFMVGGWAWHDTWHRIDRRKAIFGFT